MIAVETALEVGLRCGASPEEAQELVVAVLTRLPEARRRRVARLLLERIDKPTLGAAPPEAHAVATDEPWTSWLRFCREFPAAPHVRSHRDLLDSRSG